ncbi:MAG: CAAX prenyl protease-related protein [Acidobacteriota bacterium]
MSRAFPDKLPGGARPYVLPFAALMAILAAGPYLPVPESFRYPLRTLAVLAVLLAVSRGVVKLRPSQWLGSVAVGLAVFAIWVGPDLLAPHYREHWLLQNSVAGRVPSGEPAGAHNALWLAFRISGSVLLVPVVEELFWRAWMLRVLPFWATALLFASEHGPYWDVGLAAGIAYNWWMLRTRSLADCILAHAVTNASLAAYVLASNRWQYWL